MALLLSAKEGPREVFPAKGKQFTLQELQGFVGGYIEALAVPGKPDHVAFLNEDGKRLQLPLNIDATALLLPTAERDALKLGRLIGRQVPVDYVVGNVIVCTRIEAGEGKDSDE